MELIFIDDRLNLGQFGDLMEQRRGAVAEESATTSSAVGRLAGDGLADFLGWDQDPLGPTILGPTAAFFPVGGVGGFRLAPTKSEEGGLCELVELSLSRASRSLIRDSNAATCS